MCLMNKQGFTLIELVMVIVITGILSAIAVPKYFDLQDKAKLAAENGVVGGVRSGIYTYFTNNKVYPATLDTASNIDCAASNVCFDTILQQSGITSDWTKTASLSYQGPAGNSYIYKPTDGSFLMFSTPLGTTPTEITGNMIALIQGFYDLNGRFPRSFGDYRYTDIGLNPADWSGVVYDGLIYGAGGNRISITPAAGWKIIVMGLDGVNRILTANEHWNIWYDMSTSQWYYHNITPAEKIDISTMQKMQM